MLHGPPRSQCVSRGTAGQRGLRPRRVMTVTVRSSAVGAASPAHLRGSLTGSPPGPAAASSAESAQSAARLLRWEAAAGAPEQSWRRGLSGDPLEVLPCSRLRGGTGGARMRPMWADRKGWASRAPLSRLQLLGAAGTAGGGNTCMEGSYSGAAPWEQPPSVSGFSGGRHWVPSTGGRGSRPPGRKHWPSQARALSGRGQGRSGKDGNSDLQLESTQAEAAASRCAVSAQPPVPAPGRRGQKREKRPSPPGELGMQEVFSRQDQRSLSPGGRYKARVPPSVPRCFGACRAAQSRAHMHGCRRSGPGTEGNCVP